MQVRLSSYHCNNGLDLSGLVQALLLPITKHLNAKLRVYLTRELYIQHRQVWFQYPELKCLLIFFKIDYQYRLQAITLLTSTQLHLIAMPDGKESEKYYSIDCFHYYQQKFSETFSHVICLLCIYATVEH